MHYVLDRDFYESITSVGRQFINYFKQIYNLKSTDKEFSIIANNMQECYDSVKNIRLNNSNYSIDSKKLVVWFFTDSSSLQHIFNDEFEANIYDRFMTEMLSNNRNNRVVDILTQLLSDNLLRRFKQ